MMSAPDVTEAQQKIVTRAGGAGQNVVSLESAALRRLGMIATSQSWRRFWMPWRWKTYPWVKVNE